MRDLINLITESVGLANRKPGETFINPNGDLMEFIGLNFYPDSGKFEDQTDLAAQIADIEERTGSKIEFTNQTNAKMLAFGVVEFKYNNSIRLIGRYFANINPIFTGNFWPNSGLPDGFKYNKKSSNKVMSGLMPQDILTNMLDLSQEDILEQVTAHFGDTHPLSKLTSNIVNGMQLPIAIDISDYPDVSFEGFRDYFCEILQPIAILNGLTTGNAADAFDVFFGKIDLANATITFSSGKNTGLFDSLLVSPGGQQIKVSTKGSVGAQASVSNLIDAIDELEKSGNTALKQQYSDVVDLIKLVKAKGYIESPLQLAIEYNIIDDQDAAIVRKLKSTQDISTLSDTLLEIYNKRASGADMGRLVPFYNMLAGIAYEVADYINENTNFSEAAADILNNSALIQCYTTATYDQNNKKIVLQQFRSVYPSKQIAGVQFSPYKNYFSSGNKGNFTFKILTNKSDADKAPVTGSAVTQITPDDLLNNRVRIRPPGAKTVDTPTREKRSSSATREKR